MGKTIDNVKTTAKLTGLAALCAAATGCLGSAIVTGYGAQCGQPGAYAFGNALNQTEAAKAGRSQVNVYNGNGQGSDSSGSSGKESFRPNETRRPKEFNNAIYVNKRTGEKWARLLKDGAILKLSDRDVIDGDNLTHVESSGRKAIYIKKAFNNGDRNNPEDFDRYVFVRYEEADKTSE